MQDKLLRKLSIYSACGNIVGIAPLTLAGIDERNIEDNNELRIFLAEWGKENNIDSIMVLSGDPHNFENQGYHFDMIVFEPRGNGETGGFSTMCGNGVRAVARYAQEFVSAKKIVINTLSGKLVVSENSDVYSVMMGRLIQDEKSLVKYVNSEKLESNRGIYFESEIPEKFAFLLNLAKNWSIAFTTTNDTNPDGEPHLVIELPCESLDELKKFALNFGQLLTNNEEIFVEGINVNFISRTIITNNEIHVFNITHERNLGDDPNHSITKACGSGSTAVGGILMKKYPEILKVIVSNQGGDLIISKKSDELVMSGEAHEIVI